MKDTSWKKVGGWYSKLVGETGHYYHEHVILPNLKRLLEWDKTGSVVDLACGQGILGREVKDNNYLGIDLAANLIEEAKHLDKNKNHRYMVGDIADELKIQEKFDKAAIVLALQNVKSPFKAIENAKKLLKDKGKLVIVLNHPAFRIPKHSGWVTDKNKGAQSRTVDSYMSRMEIPIESSPFDKKNNEITYSYHWPLSVLSEMIANNGMVIEKIEEWISDKKSEGGMAKVEDKARKEIPLFMAIVVKKSCYD